MRCHATAQLSDGWVYGWMSSCWLDWWMQACIHVYIDGWSEGWMDRSMDGWMVGRTDGWMDWWINQCMDDRADGWLDWWIDHWMDGRMDGWMNGLMDRSMGGWPGGRTDGWVFGGTNSCIYHSSIPTTKCLSRPFHTIVFTPDYILHMFRVCLIERIPTVMILAQRGAFVAMNFTLARWKYNQKENG